MAKQITLSNVGESDLTFPSGDQIARGKSGAIPSDDLDHPVVKGWLASGMIQKGEIAAEEPAAPATDAAAAKKAADEAATAAAKKAADDAAAAAAAANAKTGK